jgi:hypothetical protein
MIFLTDISDLVGKKHDLESDLSTRRTDKDMLAALFNRYMCKMNNHTSLVLREEQKSKVYQTLVEHRDTVDALRAQSTY